MPAGKGKKTNRDWNLSAKRKRLEDIRELESEWVPLDEKKN